MKAPTANRTPNTSPTRSTIVSANRRALIRCGSDCGGRPTQFFRHTAGRRGSSAMGAQPSLFDVHAPALDPRDVTQVFELLDKDGSGRLAGSEVTKMFAAMCGRPVKVHGAKSSYSLNEFIEAVEDMGRRQPFLNITGNLVKYVRENKEKMKPVDAFSDERIEAVSTFLDKDKSGAIEPDELLRFLQYLHIPLFTIFGVVNSSGVIKSNAQLQRLLRKLAKQCPQLEIEQKIIKISGDIHAGDASKPPQYQEATASAEPPEPAAGRRKKALLIGINYTGSRMPLRGCINDVKSQYNVLTTKFGYSSSEIRLMTDDTNDSSKVPNKKNMMAALKWLVEGVKPGDELFFHYSGHGSQCPDRSGREPDGKNECLCPTDCTKGFPEYVITDDQMQNFFSQIPEGAKITCLFDCCHSATMGTSTHSHHEDRGGRPLFRQRTHVIDR